MTKKYTIGLDIGTASVGYAVVQDDFKLVSKKMPIMDATNPDQLLTYKTKNFWGARLFDGAETAAKRRLHRTTRRRYTRRRNRLRYLQDIFAQSLAELDPNFLNRLSESFLVPSDKQHDRHVIFGTLAEEVEYHKHYPTIYRLREELANSTEKADLRLVYLALAHILKYRGHFLIEGDFKLGEQKSLEENITDFLTSYRETMAESKEGSLTFTGDAKTLGAIFTNGALSKTQRLKEIMAYFPELTKTDSLKEFLKLILGNSVNFKKTFNLEDDHNLKFSDEDYENKLASLLAEIGDNYESLFLKAYRIYQAIVLSGIITTDDYKNKAPLSASMVQQYQKHRTQLKQLKQWVRQHCPAMYDELFKDVTKNGYAAYIIGKASKKDFHTYIKNLFNNYQDPQSASFLQSIDQDDFLKKQRNYANGAIPHQVHYQELQAILDNQGQFYPFLKSNRDKIEQIFKFRIPYYVGPLAQGKSEFAWLHRQTTEPIRPWNFENTVDKVTSATRFIERMTVSDTYLPAEKVLPRHSLMYEQFNVLNELASVSYRNEKGKRQFFTADDKKALMVLFKQQVKVKKENLVHFVENQLQIQNPRIEGIDKEFNASLTTYNNFKKYPDLKQLMDDPDQQELCEKIIRILTLFEDRAMIVHQLKELPLNLSDKTFKELSRKKLTGWGRYSSTLITLVDHEKGWTLMNYLEKDPHHRNFMQLINDDSLPFKAIINHAQEQQLKTENLNRPEQIVAELPGNPAIKKGILQSLKIVDELITIMGHDPENIVIEMARETMTTAKGLTKRREKRINEGYKKLTRLSPLNQEKDNKVLKDDRLFLYYLQNGRDMYTGAELDYHRLSDYDIDHIIPQSFTTDNSLDNRVLVSAKENRGKSNDVPSLEVIKKCRWLWEILLQAGLISSIKFNHLTKAEHGGLTEGDKEGFIKRQLVETRQITKHVAQLLDAKYNSPQSKDKKVRIMTLKAELATNFRKQFGLYKVRPLNNVHHAQDAYLNATIGQLLLTHYPSWTDEFVYGAYKRRKETATQRHFRYTNIVKNLGQLPDFNDNLAKIKRTMNCHQVNVVKKVECGAGSFMNATILPKGDSDKLIPQKKNLDPKKYGGFNTPTMFCVVAVTYNQGKKKTFEPIYIHNKKEYEQNPVAFLQQKYPTMQQMIALPKYSLFVFQDGTKRMLSGANEMQKGNQLILPAYLNTLLYHCQHIHNLIPPLAAQETSHEYVVQHRSQLDELFETIASFSEKYVKADKAKKLRDIYQQHRLDSVEDVADALVKLLDVTRMGASKTVTFFDKPISQSELRFQSLKPLWDAQLVYQSITGLYEARRSL